MAIIRLRQPAYPGGGFGLGRGQREFNIFQNEMNRLFERFFGSEMPSGSAGVYPPVNIYQDSDNIYLTAELPGMESSDISIDVEQDCLQIQGERKIESEGENVVYHRRERESGTFSRKLNFRTKIDMDKVKAEFKNGILKVTMPKAAESKVRNISITSE